MKRILFQFTPLREGRPPMLAHPPKIIINFNSRPSARGDRLSDYTSRRRAEFQFTPLREGRQGGSYSIFGNFQFQFTPLREGRRYKKVVGSRYLYFNSRPSARGDASEKGCRPIRMGFQFTPLREGRRPAPSADQHHQLFQFTPLREGRQ